MLLMVSCLEEQNFNEITPNPNQEVSFTAKVDGPETKTLYGLVAGTAMKLKWVHDDKISVYGTTCADGRKKAEYAVKTYEKITNEDGSTTVTDNIVAATPNTGDGQNYADELVKTGAAGVQWGTEQNCDFYAVYPSVADGAFSLASDKASVTVKTSVSTVQYLSFKSSSTLLQGIPYDNDSKKYGMNNAIMYARTPDLQSSATTVDLSFKPFSTVLKFTIPTWTGSTASGLGTAPTGKSIIVKSITLTAPEKVFGEFDLQIKSDGTAVVKPDTEGTSNTVTITPSEQLKWTYNQALEFSVFAIPLANVPMTDWKVAIDFTTTVTNNNETQNKDVSKTFTFGTTEKNLLAGSIHNIKVKSGFTVDAVWEYKTDSWLETIARNVYISDLSLPGSWYSTDGGYQGGTLAQQYAAGIRAFNIDCRLTLAEGKNVKDYRGSTPNDAPKYQDNMDHVNDGTLVLACAGKEVHEVGAGFLKIPSGKITSIDMTVKDALIQLGQLAASNPKEYIEVILTIAQKPKDYNYLDRWLYVYGTVNPKMVLTSIVKVLNDGEVKPYLYGYNSGEIITPNTTLNDVKGKVVVKINLNTSNDILRQWNISGPFLISEGSMAAYNKDYDYYNYVTGYIVSGVFNKMNEPLMYWSNIYSDQTSVSYEPMTYYYHQAQHSSGDGDFPSIEKRKLAILDILSESYDIYHKNTHNAMFQVGIGGWTSDTDNGKNNVSSALKPFVYDIINSMITGQNYDPVVDGLGPRPFKPAPVGIVLMNHSTAGTTHNTQKLIDAIIELNGKYFLNRDVTQPEWPND